MGWQKWARENWNRLEFQSSESPGDYAREFNGRRRWRNERDLLDQRHVMPLGEADLWLFFRGYVRGRN